MGGFLSLRFVKKEKQEKVFTYGEELPELSGRVQLASRVSGADSSDQIGKILELLGN